MPPGVGYYGGAPNAFAGGGLFQHDRRQLAHRENALNAMIERFGPEAADPASYGQLQAIDQNAQVFPHELGNAERYTDAMDANVVQYGAQAGDPTAHGIQQDQLGYLRSSASGAARVLQAAKAKGGDLGAAFDMSTNTLRALGLPTEEIAAIREQIISNPDHVDEFAAMLLGQEGGARAMSGGGAMRTADGDLRWVTPMGDGTGRELTDASGRPYTPATAEQADYRLRQGDERLNQGWRKISLEEARMRGYNAPPGHEIWEDPGTGQIRAVPIPGTEQDRDAQDRQSRIRTEEIQRVVAAQEVAERSELALASLDNTLAQLDKWGAVQGADNNASRALRSAQGLPGVQALTDVGRYKDEVETLLSHVAIDRLASIKATGATLGQITAPELAMLRASMGNLSAVGRDPELLRQDIATIRGILEKARANALSDIGTESGQGGGGGGGGDDELDELLRRYGGEG